MEILHRAKRVLVSTCELVDKPSEPDLNAHVFSRLLSASIRTQTFHESGSSIER